MSTNFLTAEEANIDLETVMSGNVWVGNSYHRAVILQHMLEVELGICQIIIRISLLRVPFSGTFL